MKNALRYEMSLSLLDQKIEKSDIVLIREFTGLPLGKLKANIEGGKIHPGELINETFYSGVNDILVLIDSFKSNYQIFSNSSEVERAFLENIAEQVRYVTFKDIR